MVTHYQHRLLPFHLQTQLPQCQLNQLYPWSLQRLFNISCQESLLTFQAFQTYSQQRHSSQHSGTTSCQPWRYYSSKKNRGRRVRSQIILPVLLITLLHLAQLSPSSFLNSCHTNMALAILSQKIQMAVLGGLCNELQTGSSYLVVS